MSCLRVVGSVGFCYPLSERRAADSSTDLLTMSGVGVAFNSEGAKSNVELLAFFRGENSEA